MSDKAAQLQQYNQDLVKCEFLRTAADHLRNMITSFSFPITILDIEVLKKKKLKIEVEISTDEKNKETISHQIRLLTDKLDEIESRQQAKRNALAKIDDTLTQSEIGEFKLRDFWQSDQPTYFRCRFQDTPKSSIHCKFCLASLHQRLTWTMIIISSITITEMFICSYYSQESKNDL